jgi:hypothetical protein
MIVAIEGLIPGPRARSSQKTPGAGADAPSDLGPAPDRTLDSSDPIFVHPFSPSGTIPSSPHARVPDSAADNRVPSSIEKNPSTWRLRL